MASENSQTGSVAAVLAAVCWRSAGAGQLMLQGL